MTSTFGSAAADSKRLVDAEAPKGRPAPLAKGKTTKGQAMAAKGKAPRSAKAMARAVAALSEKGVASRRAKRKTAVKRPRAKPAGFSYVDVFRASPIERIAMIRRGIPALDAKRLFTELHIDQSAGFKALDFATATINRKAQRGANLSKEEGERFLGFAKLVGQLESLVEESGDPKGFDPIAWLSRWLEEPMPAFGGTRPADLLDTIEGQGLVSSVLAKIESGAFA